MPHILNGILTGHLQIQITSLLKHLNITIWFFHIGLLSPTYNVLY